MEKEKSTIGYIHSYESLAAADGPGLRFAAFVQGCALRCKYCHNPDSWKIKSEGAKKVSPLELADEIKKYKNYFGKRGGATISGGEPLLQLDFLIELFEILRSENIHTAIDTSGAEYDENDSRYDRLLASTNLVLLDIKHIDDKKCRALTGKGNQKTKAFAARLAREGIPVWIRQVLVPGYTDDPEDLRRTRLWIDSLPNVEKVEVLPYHTLGKIKYDKLGIDYPLKGVGVPTEESVEKARKILVEKN